MYLCKTLILYGSKTNPFILVPLCGLFEPNVGGGWKRTMMWKHYKLCMKERELCKFHLQVSSWSKTGEKNPSDNCHRNLIS